MNEEKKKQRRNKILLILFIVLSIPLYINYNLRRYSIYYAQHMPHAKDKDPVMVMVINNIHWINKPDIPEFKDYSYDFDGNKAILVKGKESSKFMCTGSVIHVNVDYDKSIDPEGNLETSYFYAYTGKLEWESNVEENITEKEIREGKELTYSIIQPYIDHQFLPLINLQWVFNQRYMEQFR